jgi:hypothetical protein
MTTNNSPLSLRDLVAAPVAIQVGSVLLSVQPLSWWASVDVIDAIAPALATMPQPPAEGTSMDATEWLMWVSGNRAAVVNFATLASGQDGEVIKALPPGALVELVFGLFEVNADFFLASLPASIARLADRMGGLKDRVAQTVAVSRLSMSGNTSSSAATATPT